MPPEASDPEAEPRPIAVVNARVHTVDEAMPRAEAVLVRDGRIAWLGDDAGARERIDPGTEVIDAGGGLVLPGIVDSHNHVRLGAVDEAVQLHDARTISEILGRIATWLRERPNAEWVEGVGWNYTAIPGGRPRAELLDDATGGRPACLFSFDVHTAWLNREGMRRFGISRDTPDVPFGDVEMDPSTGEPTGFVTGFAVKGLSRHGQAALEPVLPSFAKGAQYARLVRSLDMAAELGITMIVEPQNSVDDLPLFARARDEGTLRSRLIAALFHPPGTTDADLEEFEEARRTYYDDHLRVAPIKLYIDDVIEPHTAALLEPYADRPETRGETFWDPAEFAEVVTRLDARGFQTFTHAIGDRGIRTALDAIEHARTVNGDHDARHQLVHVEVLAPADVPRFEELGVVACMQPRHFAPDIAGGAWADAVGADRLPISAPWRSLHESGAALAFSSDWNVAEMDPLIGIYTALTRANLGGDGAWVTEQTVDLETAIRAYTMGGAWANHCEADRGSITPGKYADLIVLSQDLFELEREPLGILDARVELTMVGGEIVHRAS